MPAGIGFWGGNAQLALLESDRGGPIAATLLRSCSPGAAFQQLAKVWVEISTQEGENDDREPRVLDYFPQALHGVDICERLTH